MQPWQLPFYVSPEESRLCVGCQLGIDLRSNSIGEALVFLEVTLTLTQHMVIWNTVYKNPYFN